MCPRIPKVHTMRGLVKAQGLLFKSSFHFSLKNHFPVMHGMQFLPQSSPQVPAKTRKSIRKVPCEEGKESGQQDRHRTEPYRADGFNWCKGSCTFSPLASRTDAHAHRQSPHAHTPGHAHMYITRAHIPGHMRPHAHAAQVCDVSRLLLLYVRLRGRW